MFVVWKHLLRRLQILNKIANKPGLQYRQYRTDGLLRTTSPLPIWTNQRNNEWMEGRFNRRTNEQTHWAKRYAHPVTDESTYRQTDRWALSHLLMLWLTTIWWEKQNSRTGKRYEKDRKDQRKKNQNDRKFTKIVRKYRMKSLKTRKKRAKERKTRDGGHNIVAVG